MNILYIRIPQQERHYEYSYDDSGLTPFQTGKPFWGTQSLGIGIGRGLGVVKGAPPVSKALPLS